MPDGVEVSRICTLAALEVNLSELLASREDVALASGVEYWDAIAATYFNHCIYHFLSVATYESLASPWCEEEYLRSWVFFYQSAAQYAQTLFESAHADRVESSFRSIVMSGYH